MKEEIRNLEGSVNKDKFMRKHKDLHGSLVIADTDINFIDYFGRKVLDIGDYKREGDNITESQTIVWDDAIKNGKRVYIIEETRAGNAFRIIEYFGGGAKSPILELVRFCNNWTEYEEWELSLHH